MLKLTSFEAMKLTVQHLQRSKQLLAQTGILLKFQALHVLTKSRSQNAF